jgi:hypothetical protein
LEIKEYKQLDGMRKPEGRKKTRNREASYKRCVTYSDEYVLTYD